MAVGVLDEDLRGAVGSLLRASVVDAAGPQPFLGRFDGVDAEREVPVGRPQEGLRPPRDQVKLLEGLTPGARRADAEPGARKVEAGRNRLAPEDVEVEPAAPIEVRSRGWRRG